MAAFDPAAWVAEYEAIGGHACVVRWHGENEGLWLGLTYPRDEAGRGYQMLEELNAGNASGAEGRARNLALQNYIVATRGVMETPAHLRA